jgi:hypothetical protein
VDLRRAVLVAALGVLACDSTSRQSALSPSDDGGPSDASDATAPDVADQSLDAAVKADVPPHPARCCQILFPPSAGDGVDPWTAAKQDAGLAAASCLDRADAGHATEPCWDSNPAGLYARWTCGSNATSSDPGAPWCSNDGLSCAVGDPCFLQDIGCPGTVIDCEYPWYPTP